MKTLCSQETGHEGNGKMATTDDVRPSIFFVDDDESIRGAWATGFSQPGFEPPSVGSAEEALKVLETEDIHVMFVDLRLSGMDGIEFCSTIRKARPFDCIYAMTGYSSAFSVAACREVGFDDYFVKPVGFGVLIKAAEDAFGRIERWSENESGLTE